MSGTPISRQRSALWETLDLLTIGADLLDQIKIDAVEQHHGYA